MESPGSEISTDSTDSSSVDSTSTDSTPAQAIPSMSENRNPPAMDSTTIIDNDDSASDISMSTDSDNNEGEGQDNASSQVIQASADTVRNLSNTETSGETSKKRKFSVSEDTTNGLDQIPRFEVHKRLKLDSTLQQFRTPEGHLPKDRALLPAEIWHHIFSFCSPRVLGVLLQVNRSFNAYLDPSSSGSSPKSLSVSATQILTPASIWRASRMIYNLPAIPSPLLGRSELDMWKLACGSICQSCGKKRKANSGPVDQWHPGPGENGVSAVWSFETRVCGPCLQKVSMKVGLNFFSSKH